ncbi:hypothetical protein [Alicyclobacillus mengziensis]|uniref:Uncharacterized protein n=1 Tax=Alicyclobacillus mengziensis TaxID=2931921 RepID=A0A9X7VXA3_9BACL|nr:hypothetical protein [Alicyclobacillus mengziensis]QSO46781.1 hypothetical protein JZ786_20455 [Alicyclobacillus mengziensis]
MISRRSVQSLLGFIWFIDGLFQIKPQMFTRAFIQQVILPTAQGEPHWVTAIVNWGASLTSPHIAMWNTVFALVQILLGLAFLFNFRLRATIVASLVWSLVVWVFGEGFGQLFTGQSLLLTGAPGAVVIYALLGVVIWPSKSQTSDGWSHRGRRFAQLSMAGLFLLGCVLHLQSMYLTPTGLSGAMAVSWVGTIIGHGGAVISVILAAIELMMAVLFVFRIRLRATVWTALVLAFVFWWVGQSFGQVFDPLSTDFNSGIVMMLLAAAAYPHRIYTDWYREKVRRKVLA